MIYEEPKRSIADTEFLVPTDAELLQGALLGMEWNWDERYKIHGHFVHKRVDHNFWIERRNGRRLYWSYARKYDYLADSLPEALHAYQQMRGFNP